MTQLTCLIWFHMTSQAVWLLVTNTFSWGEMTMTVDDMALTVAMEIILKFIKFWSCFLIFAFFGHIFTPTHWCFLIFTVCHKPTGVFEIILPCVNIITLFTLKLHNWKIWVSQERKHLATPLSQTLHFSIIWIFSTWFVKIYAMCNFLSQSRIHYFWYSLQCLWKQSGLVIFLSKSWHCFWMFIAQCQECYWRV